MQIKDLVHMDESGSFRSDVQLSDYDNQTLNLELLNNYIFTISAPVTSQAGRDVAAKDVLAMLKEAFMISRAGSDFNRVVLTANYGRGKSHLALVLANFFSRPFHSKEVKIILERLGQALGNPAQLNGFKEFKQTKGEFLVLRLRGDAINDLQEGFIYALEQALKEHDVTDCVRLPFWYFNAEAWLTSQNHEILQKIETFLENEHTDLATLRKDIRKTGTFELLREAVKHVTGFYPDFGRELNLTELIDWAVNEVCVPNHLGGLLILFDEFSLFLQKYATSRTPGKLQELLNGISNHPGKSAFLAFTQLDIESVVETYAQGNRREDVKRELDRLPRDKRARLFSLMEGVLDAYLKQDEPAWNAWWDRQEIRRTMARHRETLFTYFPKRYSETLQWDHNMVEKVIVRGCYPLHPLTTAILSTHTFEAGAGENPRTALHFVRDRWSKGVPDQPAEGENGTPNFIFAIELVDFFGEQISKRWYAAYRHALESPTISLTEHHKAVLKALLLQSAVSELSSQRKRGSDQIELLSDLSGLDFPQVSSLLKELAKSRVIQKTDNFYSLFPVGARSPEADRIIEEAVQKTPVDRALLEEIAKEIPPLTIPQTFGNSEDWASRQVVLTKEYFDTEILQELTARYRIGTNGIQESPRGVIIWLLAKSEEEKLWFRQQAQALLDSVLGMGPHPLPVLIVLPQRVNPDLLNAAQRRKALQSLDLSQREKIGSIVLNDEKSRAEVDLKNGVYHLLGDDFEHYADLGRQIHEFVVPREYLASVQTLRIHSIKAVLTECYRQAYQYRVEFSDKPVLTRGVNHLRTAVENITRGLFDNTVGQSIRNLTNQDMQYKIAVDYLATKWGLLDKQNLNIQLPTSRSLREAWNRLESVFPPGCGETPAKEVLVELLNPPYGHDYNTLTLLLAAWIGFHRHEIQLSLGGKIITLDEFRQVFDNARGPKGFLETLISGGFTIQHINIDERYKEIDAIIDRIRKKDSPFSISEAEQALKKLEQALSNPQLPANRMDLIKSYCPLLKQNLDTAQKYDQSVLEWQSQLHSADVEKLLMLGDSLRKISVSDLVLPSKPSLSDLKKEWETRLDHELDLYCERYSKLTDLSLYATYKHQLEKVLRQVQEYPHRVSKVQKALELLKQRQQDLRQHENEKTIVAEIQSMAPSARLVTLYEYRTKLIELQNLSTETENLRKSKLEQIESRIQQFEQLVKMLPEAVEKAKSLDDLRGQKSLLLRNLDQTQDTPLYQQLEEIQNRIERLENFFENLRDIASLPRLTPSDLDTISHRIREIETQYSDCLGQAQRDILSEKRRQVDSIRQQEEQKARQWLIDLGVRYTNGARADELLRIAQNPPEFLPGEDRVKLNQLIQALQQKVEKDTLLKIEMLFMKLDTEARRKCLKQLQDLMEQP